MRVNRLEIRVADVEAAIAWWRRLLPDAEPVGDGIIDAGGLELRFVRGESRGFLQAFIQVAPERLERVASEYAAPMTTGGDGSRSIELDAPGGGTVCVFTQPEEEAYAE